MSDEIDSIVGDFLRVTVDDIKRQIEPDAGLRILLEATCDHKTHWNRSHQMCFGCGVTEQELWNETRNA